MSEDAPVNTGAVEWPDPDLAYFAVRRMQTKLHQWAREGWSQPVEAIELARRSVKTSAGVR